MNRAERILLSRQIAAQLKDDPNPVQLVNEVLGPWADNLVSYDTHRAWERFRRASDRPPSLRSDLEAGLMELPESSLIALGREVVVTPPDGESLERILRGADPNRVEISASLSFIDAAGIGRAAVALRAKSEEAHALAMLLRRESDAGDAANPGEHDFDAQTIDRLVVPVLDRTIAIMDEIEHVATHEDADRLGAEARVNHGILSRLQEALYDSRAISLVNLAANVLFRIFAPG